MSFHRFLTSSLLPALLAASTLATAPADAQDPPTGVRNVLLLIADDMGIDRSRQYLALNGNLIADLPATPTVRRLRQSGIGFNSAWSNPVCSPTRAGFFTGRHSFRHGVANAIPSAPDLDLAETTLPELIAGAGYVSGLFGKWHVSDDLDGPLDQGFDEHRGTISGALPAYDAWQKVVNGVEVDANPATPAIDLETQYATEAAVEDAYDWISQQTEPWLAVVAFNAPHTPLHTPTAACDGVASNVPDFNAMVECIDVSIDWLLTELELLGELEDTTVFFFGDNGTTSASVLGPFDTSPNPSHKLNVYEGGIRVPFIVSDGYHLVNGSAAPSTTGVGYIAAPRRREDAMIHTVDIFATVAEIAGVASAADDSISMIPYLESAAAGDQRLYNYTDRCTSQMFQATIRDDQYKLIYRLDYTVLPLNPLQELYEVGDLDESNDLYLTGLGVEAALWTERNAMWASEGFNPLVSCP